jgi:hypothetical protein
MHVINACNLMYVIKIELLMFNNDHQKDTKQ